MSKKIKKFLGAVTLSAFTLSLLPINFDTTNANSTLVYPLKKISKLECRFNDFSTLGNECLEDLPILRTADYKKYATQNGGYNKFTRLYTVLWGASYKYGWDVGYGGHMGIDIATAKGTPVYSIADGEVINAKFGAAEGNLVSIKHNINGKIIVSNYFHLNNYSVSKGQKVRAGDQIGTVGSTGNSTGNHLHLQIDTLTTYSPIYYNRATCPYSYYEITEKGHCFNELERITVDPLLFLETNGGVLNSNVNTNKVTTVKNTNINTNTTKTVTKKTETITINQNASIFDRNVFIGSVPGDVREVQTIYKSLGYYKGEITGDYNDVLEAIIKYQLAKGIISARGEPGTGNFGPKTRAQTKIDYTTYIKNGGKISTTFISNNTTTNVNANGLDVNDLNVADDNRVISKTEKISRENLMTREELEAKEVNDFIKDYNINLNFENNGNVKLNGTETLHLSVTDKRGKFFKGNMPGSMTFEIEKEKISIFPEKLFHFTDGKREIKITGLKEGQTKLNVKVGNVIIKTFNINIGNGVKTITPDSIQIIDQKIGLGQTKTGIGILKQGNRSLTNIEYSGTFKLKAGSGNLVCIKKGSISNIKNIYKSTCKDKDFKSEITFTYKDTVGGLLIFDYKAVNRNLKLEVTNSFGKKLGTKDVAIEGMNNGKVLIN